jgi:hypothetical protein
MSLHRINAEIAANQHREVFGSRAGDPDQVEYRESSSCNWRLLDYAVVHGEFISTLREGRETRRSVRRSVFVDAKAVPSRLNAHVRIGGECGQVYNVTEVTSAGTRLQLHLTRHQIMEVSRPDLRTTQRTNHRRR